MASHLTGVNNPSYSYGDPIPLRELEFITSQLLGEYGLDPPVDLKVNKIANTVVLDFRTSILAHKMGGDRIERRKAVEFSHPDGRFQRWRARHEKSWWHHWTTHWRPIRMLAHREVVKLVVEVEDYAMFPKLARPDSWPSPAIYRRVQYEQITSDRKELL